MEFRPYGDHKIDVTTTSVTSYEYVIPYFKNFNNNSNNDVVSKIFRFLNLNIAIMT